MHRKKSGVREGCVDGARRMYSGSWWFFGGLQQECPAVHCVTSLVIESTAGKSSWNISAEHLDIINYMLRFCGEAWAKNFFVVKIGTHIEMLVNRVKHLNMRIQFVRELTQESIIAVHFVPTKHNVADMLTKALPRSQFEYLRTILMLGHGGK